MSVNFLNQWIVFSQAQMALGIKAALDIGHVLQERQGAAAIELLHAQLGLAGSGGGGEALRALAEVQSALTSNLDSHWRAALDSNAQRTQTCLGDLREAQNGTEVGGVLALYLQDIGERLRADAAHSGELLGSAASANKVLLARTLDGMIAAQAGPAAPDAPPQQAA